MSARPQVHDSPAPWVAEHIRRYVASDGEDGHEWRGARVLLLTVTGRRSGKRRRTALIYGRDGERYVVVASQGGAPEHPQWYRNLVDDPRVEVQVGAELFAARARTARATERERLWALMLAEWPDYEQYQRRTDREIPVVILEPEA